MSPPLPFEQLRNFLNWQKDFGQTWTCCQRASDEEIAANPEAFDCDACELMQQVDGLWHDNAEAWSVYQDLCGRTVRDFRLEGWTLDRITDGWGAQRALLLVKRLDLILSVLEPHGRSPEN